MEEDFLGYIMEWESAVQGRDDLSTNEKNKLMLSRETIDGLRMTGKSFKTIEYIRRLILFLVRSEIICGDVQVFTLRF